MKDILFDIIGYYEPIMLTEESYSLDWPWILSVVVLITLISCSAWFACKILCGVLRD